MFSKEKHFTSVIAQGIISDLSRSVREAEKAASERAKREAIRTGGRKAGLQNSGGKKFQRMAARSRG